MRRLILTRGKHALVDDADYARLMDLRKHWQATSRRNLWYAVTDFWHPTTKKRRKVYLHRWIMGAPAGQLVDHKNGNGLDNQRHNLRLATCGQNAWNKHQKTQSASGYRGVRQVKNGTGWVAYIKHAGTQISIGSFETVSLAACARDYYMIDNGLARYAKLNYKRLPHTREEVESGRTYVGAKYPNIRFKDGKWEANVREQGRKRYLGRFDSLEDARRAQRLAVRAPTRYIRRIRKMVIA